MRMRRMVWAGVCATGALLPATNAAGAQMPVQVGLVLGAGGTFRGEVPSDTYYTGLGYNVLGGVVLSVPVLPISIRLEGQYDEFSTPLSTYEDRVYSATANAQYTIAFPFIHPYLIGGVGYYHLADQYFNPNQAPGNPDEINANLNGAGINGGAGLRSGIGGFGVFAEWRYHYIFAGGPGNTTGHVSYAPFTFGVTL
jgi:hypothetical protein